MSLNINSGLIKGKLYRLPTILQNNRYNTVNDYNKITLSGPIPLGPQLPPPFISEADLNGTYYFDVIYEKKNGSGRILEKETAGIYVGVRSDAVNWTMPRFLVGDEIIFPARMRTRGPQGQTPGTPPGCFYEEAVEEYMKRIKRLG